MAVVLLDVNVLFALAWERHEHHDAARLWFESRHTDGWATCPMTEAGFLRLSLNPSSIGHVLSTTEATDTLRHLINKPSHVFWHDDLSVLDGLIPLQRLRGHRQVADAYLFALSIAHNGVLATFDRGILSLASTPEQQKAVEIIPIQKRE